MGYQPLAVTSNKNAFSKKYVGAHFVLSLTNLNSNGTTVQAILQGFKDTGHNVLWCHPDEYDPSQSLYKTSLLAFITAAETINAADPANPIYIIPGLMLWADTSTNYSYKKQGEVINDCYLRAGVLTINKVPVFMHYYYFGVVASGGGTTFDQTAMNNYLLNTYGIKKTDWMLIMSGGFPFSDDNRSTWATEFSQAGITANNYSGVNKYVGLIPGFRITDRDRNLTNWPWVEGLVNFGTNLPAADIIAWNAYDLGIANRRHLPGGMWLGIAGFYASYGFFDYGWSHLINVANQALVLPIENRPTGIMAITANDDIEFSRMSYLPGFTNGIRYLGPAGTYVNNGTNSIPTPVLDRSGMTAAILPQLTAFKNNLPSAVYTDLRIFMWSMLHPYNAAFISTIPAGAVSAGYSQANWDTSLYKIGDHTITGIKTIANVDDIKMAAHLPGPIGTQYYLKINSTLSSIITITSANGQIATFSIPMSGFTGFPVFSIIAANGTTVLKTGTSPQAISASCWPGGWGILSVEL